MPASKQDSNHANDDDNYDDDGDEDTDEGDGEERIHRHLGSRGSLSPTSTVGVDACRPLDRLRGNIVTHLDRRGGRLSPPSTVSRESWLC